MEVDNKQKTNNKPVLAAVLISIFVILLTVFIAFNKGQQKRLQLGDSIKTTAGNTPASTSSGTTEKISMSEVNKHNSQTSCWTVIEGEVFDLTKYIPMHKGGDIILKACGQDATDLFTGKSPMGRMHSQMARKLLQSMKVGTL